jgi:hypothetical protein
MEPVPEYDDRYLATIYGGICSQTKRSLNCVLNDVNVMARVYLSWFEAAFNQSATRRRRLMPIAKATKAASTAAHRTRWGSAIGVPSPFINHNGPRFAPANQTRHWLS